MNNTTGDFSFLCRTCVNGSPIDSKTRVRHGDRVLWGNNHFFRLNIPRRDSSKLKHSSVILINETTCGVKGILSSKSKCCVN